MNHKKQLPPAWVIIATAVFCFVAIADLPYGYYRLLRWVACAVAVVSVIQLARSGKSGWAWGMVLVAIVFNPILPVHFEKATWRVLDGGAGLAFLGVLWVSRKGRATGEGGEGQSG